MAQPRFAPEDAVALAGFAGVSLSAAALARPRDHDDVPYALARRPSWQLPDRVMGPAWMAEFGVIGLSGWAAWRGHAGALPFALWGTYLVGNSLGTRAHLRLRQQPWRNAAGAAVLALFAWAVGRKSPLAAALMVPSIGWLAYVSAAAGALNHKNPVLAGLF